MSQKLPGFLSVAFLVLVAPALCIAQITPDDTSLDDFLAKIRDQKPDVAPQFEKLLKQAKNDLENIGPGHVIFGQIVVEGENVPRAVVAQMRILPGGYFVDAAGPESKPIGFRLHGYEAVNVTPQKPGSTENLGIIRMKPLPPERLATAKGLVQFEWQPGVPRMDQVEITWAINGDPVNSATGGSRGTQPVRFKSKVNADGTFSVSGLSPARYTVSVSAPKCGGTFRRVEFAEGETREMKPFTLQLSRRMNIEFTVSTDCDFRKSTVSKANLGANESWLSTGENKGMDEDLYIRPKADKLMLSSSRQPCYLVDLGEAQLDEKRDVGPDAAVSNNQQDLLAENGHVYPVHHPGQKRWVLFRTTLLELDYEGQAAAKPGKSAAAGDTEPSDTSNAGSAKRKANTTLTGTKRQDRIKALLAWAIANDDEEHGTAALKALDELLELEPDNADGTRLREKIRKYYPQK